MAPALLQELSSRSFDYGATSTNSSSGSDIESGTHEDSLESIAVIGFSLTFPDDATSPDSFWAMLTAGRCASRDFPKDRVNLEAFYDPETEKLGSLPLRGGHFIREDLAAFDAPFFSITPAEAAAMDPLQRGLLETSYKALENAGIPLEETRGSRTSVHIGCFNTDHTSTFGKDPEYMPKYTGTGGASSMLSNRLSWFLDLKGPSLTIDTACSSSMVALDVACQALRNGESNMGLVGGCNLMYSLDMTIALSNLGFLSHDSRCYSFDHRANGYARGEGFGIVILKRVTDAVRDGDTIRAVIRSTGSNSDGHTPGITLPDKDSQANLICDTYRKAGLDMHMTNYFEAHGTGTPVGDPIEVGAIGSAFKHRRSGRPPLHIGAVKSNVGHLEGASGIAGLIKTIMVLEKGIIPPNANFERINPHIDADFLDIQFPTQSIIWPGNGLRRASINSFGFGGTNSHAIVDDAYNYLHQRNLSGNHCTVQRPFLPEVSRVMLPLSTAKRYPYNKSTYAPSSNNIGTLPKILIWSAADKGGMSRLEAGFREYFSKLVFNDEDVGEYLDSLAYTLRYRRTSLPWKAFATASSIEQIRNLTWSKPVQSNDQRGLAFVFTGQGAQWHGMGRELLKYALFRNSLLKAQLYFQTLGCEWLLLDEMSKGKETSRIQEPQLSQPLCTALQVALVDLFRAVGINPSTVIGHSSGEIAAAYSIGALSRESAWKVAYYRGALASALLKDSQVKQAMMSVGLSEQEISPYLESVGTTRRGGKLTISCINSPRNITISGEAHQIDILHSMLEKDKVFARKLKVDVAYHSPYMEKIAAEYLLRIGNLKHDVRCHPRKKMIFVSSVSGKPTSTNDLCRGEYWVQNMVSPVRFKEALERISQQSASKRQKKLDLSHQKEVFIHDLIEIGPHSALQGPIRETTRGLNLIEPIGYLSALVRNKSAIETVLDAVGQLYCLGYPVNLQAVNRPAAKPSVCSPVLPNLPEYPFDHTQTYWDESRLSKGFRFRQQPRVELLGSQVPDWNPLEAKWRNVLKVSDIPWVSDHQVNGSILFPAAGMLVMAIEAARQMSEKKNIMGYEIKDTTFHAPINMSLNPDGVETHLYLRPLRGAADKDNAWAEFRLHVGEKEQWAETCRGMIKVQYEAAPTEIDSGLEAANLTQSIRKMHSNAAQSCTKAADARYVYDRLKGCGLDYGKAFQPLKQLRYSDNVEAVTELKVFPEPLNRCEVIHPTTLDGMFQLTFVALTKGGIDSIPTTVATRINRLWVANSGLSAPNADSVLAYAKTKVKGYRVAESSLSALSIPDQQLKIQIDGFESTAITSATSAALAEALPKQVFYNVEWKPDMDTMERHQILEYCEKGLVLKPDRESFFHDLSFLLFSYISTSLQQLVDLKSTVPQIQRYVAWMRIQSESQPQGKPLIQDSEYVDSLSNRLESSNQQGKFYVEIGRKLSHILSGEVNIVDLLFGQDLIKNFYEDLNTSGQHFDRFAPYLDALVHKNPRMKILEVGAATGAAASILLELLKDESGNPTYTQYDISDKSPSFLEEAKLEYHRYSRMNFKALDIESNLFDEVLEEASYDLIVTSHTHHATRDLNATLRNLQRLLKPGGKLVLLEAMKPSSLIAGFAFGLLPGWSLGSHGMARNKPEIDTLDVDSLENFAPCDSHDDWDEILKRNGFSGVDLEFPDFQSETSHYFSIVVSTNSTMANTLVMPEILVLFNMESESQRYLAKALRSRFQELGCLDCSIFSLQEVALGIADLGRKCCVLLEESHQSILRNVDLQTFESIRSVLLSAKMLLWVTYGGQSPMAPDFGVVQGLSRVLRTEISKLSITTLALEASQNTNERKVESIMHAFRDLVRGSAHRDHEPEYVEQNGMLLINRLKTANYLNQDVFTKTSPPTLGIQEFGSGPPLQLSIGTPGLLDTFQFREDTTQENALLPRQIEVEVRAIGLNFLDCLAALGRVNATTLGSECAGIITRVGDGCKLRPGDRVSLCSLDVFRTYARSTEDCAIKIPDDLSFVDAAAIPTTFTTVYYGLCEVARMQKGETILIHAGAGGTGQAAIQIAKHVGLEIYTTVGSEKKKRLLQDLYGIPESNILYSRDLSFAQGVMRLTNNRGVDIVLNSLAGEGLVASWECVAPYGRFIEIGKKDIYSHGKLPMFPFAANVSFSAIDLAFEPQNRPPVIRRSFENSMALLAEKAVHPAYPLQVFGLHEIEKAFRHLQSGNNAGKTVIEFNPEAKVPTFLQPKPAYSFDKNATYLIAGGLGGIGRSIARWMVSRGARNLLLLSRSGPGEKARTLLEELKAKGAQVETPICDVTDASSLNTMLKTYGAFMPPIKGCIQASMVLRDATIENMLHDDWEACIQPKVQGSWNLHELLPRKMDFFILLSSVSGIFGNGGQANYAAGNAYQDALARYRIALGEKAAALDIGALLSTGVLAENGGSLNRSIRTGILPPMSEAELLALIDYYCNPSLSISTQLNCQAVTGIETPANLQVKGMDEPYWMQQPFFRHLYQIESTAGSTVATEKALDFSSLFSAANSLSEAGKIVSDALVEKLSKILNMPSEDISNTKPLSSYGVDSLVAVELRNWFARALSAEVAIFEILGGPSIQTVGVLVAGKSQYRQASWME